jgi:tRNA modification GTPase
MLVEATLDFPEEEIDFLQRADALGQLAGIRAELDHVLSQARQGALLREGMNVVLAGRPNVGKSSLLNALAGAEVAIVTPVAGTTRDRVAQAIQVDGVPLNVIDTAGLRDTEDEVERIGIARTWDAVARADVILHLLDVSDPQHTEMDQRIAQHLPRGVPLVRVFNKVDLAGGEARAQGRDAVWLSAKTGAGIDGLRRVLLELAGWQGAGEGQFIARERHLQALRAAADHLVAAGENAQRQAQALELFAEELRLAQEALSEITGEFTADDLLGVIFGRFCIGK